MRTTWMTGCLAILATTGCARSEPEPEEPMKVEETAFGDLVGTQDKARDMTNQAMDAHRKALDAQVKDSEGAPPED